MSEMRIRAAKALEAAAKAEHATVGGYRYYLPDADAALLAALDPEDEALRDEVQSAMLACGLLASEADARSLITNLRNAIRSPHEHGAPQT